MSAELSEVSLQPPGDRYRLAARLSHDGARRRSDQHHRAELAAVYSGAADSFRWLHRAGSGRTDRATTAGQPTGSSDLGGRPAGHPSGHDSQRPGLDRARRRRRPAARCGLGRRIRRAGGRVGLAASARARRRIERPVDVPRLARRAPVLLAGAGLDRLFLLRRALSGRAGDPADQDDPLRRSVHEHRTVCVGGHDAQAHAHRGVDIRSVPLLGDAARIRGDYRRARLGLADGLHRRLGHLRAGDRCRDLPGTAHRRHLPPARHRLDRHVGQHGRGAQPLPDGCHHRRPEPAGDHRPAVRLGHLRVRTQLAAVLRFHLSHPQIAAVSRHPGRRPAADAAGHRAAGALSSDRRCGGTDLLAPARTEFQRILGARDSAADADRAAGLRPLARPSSARGRRWSVPIAARLRFRATNRPASPMPCGQRRPKPQR